MAEDPTPREDAGNEPRECICNGDLRDFNCPIHGGVQRGIAGQFSAPDGRPGCPYCEERLRVNVGLLAENQALKKAPVRVVEQRSGTEGEDDTETRCRRCNGPNVSWSAPSPLWNAVMRGGSIDGPWEFGELICPTCFAVLAEERGIADGWKVAATTVHVPLETVTPSGRVWDESVGLWVLPESPERQPDDEARTEPDVRAVLEQARTALTDAAKLAKERGFSEWADALGGHALAADVALSCECGGTGELPSGWPCLCDIAETQCGVIVGRVRFKAARDDCGRCEGTGRVPHWVPLFPQVTSKACPDCRPGEKVCICCGESSPGDDCATCDEREAARDDTERQGE